MNLKKLLAKLKFEQIPTIDGAAVLEVDGELKEGIAVKITDASGQVLNSGEFVVLYNGRELKVIVENGVITAINDASTVEEEVVNKEPVNEEVVNEFTSFATELLEKIVKQNKQITELKMSLVKLADEVNKLKLQTNTIRKSTPIREAFNVEELRKKFNI